MVKEDEDTLFPIAFQIFALVIFAIFGWSLNVAMLEGWGGIDVFEIFDRDEFPPPPIMNTPLLVGLSSSIVVGSSGSSSSPTRSSVAKNGVKRPSLKYSVKDIRVIAGKGFIALSMAWLCRLYILFGGHGHGDPNFPIIVLYLAAGIWLALMSKQRGSAVNQFWSSCIRIIFPFPFFAAKASSSSLPSKEALKSSNSSSPTTFISTTTDTGNGNSSNIGLLNRIPFCDNLLADIFCSFAKTLAELFVLPFSLSFGQQAAKSTVHLFVGQQIVLALPFCWRLWQCLYEFKSTREKKHFFNALKYSCAFPVVLVVTLQGLYQSDFHDYWIFAIFLQTIFSLWWDVYMDWDLGHVGTLENASNASRKRNLILPTTSDYSETAIPTFTFLRPKLILFPGNPYPYYLCILGNALIRFSWLAKAYHLEKRNDSFGGSLASSSTVFDSELYVFGFQVLEIFRRWIWIFLRLENQCLSSTTSSLSSMPSPNHRE